MSQFKDEKIYIVRCLYNNGYGELDVSQECRDKYKELYHVDLDEDINCCRTDQNIINVIDILGLEKCSGPTINIRLRIEWIPKEMEEYLVVTNYDGQETIYIDYNEAYTKVLHNLMKHNCHGSRNLNSSVMSSVWSSCEQCNCIPKDAYDKYERINYIKEKMRNLPRRNSKEMPDATIFSYEL